MEETLNPQQTAAAATNASFFRLTYLMKLMQMEFDYFSKQANAPKELILAMGAGKRQISFTLNTIKTALKNPNDRAKLIEILNASEERLNCAANVLEIMMSVDEAGAQLIEDAISAAVQPAKEESST